MTCPAQTAHHLSGPPPHAAWARRLWLAALALVTVTTADVASAADPPQPRLVAAEEPATIRAHPKLPWRRLAVGRSVALGQDLRCPSSCRIALGGDARLDLEGGALVRAEGPRFTRLPGDTLARRVDVVGLRAGVGLLERPKEDGSAIVLELASGQRVALRSGRLEAHGLGDRSVIALHEGTALFGSGAAWTALEPGRHFEVRRSGRLVPRAPVAPASWDPTGRHHRPVAIATDDPEATVSVSWSNEGPRSKQRLRITDSAGAVVLDRAVDPEADHVRLTLEEGRYEARVTVADEDGVWSPPSAALPLRVVRVALPAGAFHASADTFVVPEASTLRLLGAKGVEIAVGRGGFLPARREIGLPDAQTTVLRLRLAGQPTTESRFYVERRELEAQITLGPSAPVWPEDVISAEVRLVDPSGHVDVKTIKPRFRVRLGADDVPAHFTYNGTTWHGRIPGRALRKPQLLELTVEDEVGQAIGHAFVEVVAHRRKR